MKLGDLKVGDKFRFPEGHTNYDYGRPYLVIDFDLENYSFNVITDITKVKMCLDLVAYKIVGFNGDVEVEQDKDNIPVESALDIIKRQKAEIERLNNKCDSISFCHGQEIAEAKAWAKAESIIEFAEKLKEIGKQEGAYDYVSLWDIDKLLKDMTGED